MAPATAALPRDLLRWELHLNWRDLALQLSLRLGLHVLDESTHCLPARNQVREASQL